MTYLGDEWAQGYVLDGIDYAPLITIRQILDHTDGFHEYAFDPGFYLLASSRLMYLDPQEVVDWDLNEDRYSFPEPNILTIRSAMLLPDSSSNQ